MLSIKTSRHQKKIPVQLKYFFVFFQNPVYLIKTDHHDDQHNSSHDHNDHDLAGG